MKFYFSFSPQSKTNGHANSIFKQGDWSGKQGAPHENVDETSAATRGKSKKD